MGGFSLNPIITDDWGGANSPNSQRRGKLLSAMGGMAGDDDQDPGFQRRPSYWGSDPGFEARPASITEGQDVGFDRMPRTNESPKLLDRMEADNTPHPQGLEDSLMSPQRVAPQSIGKPGVDELTPWTPRQRSQDRLAALTDQYEHLGDTPPKLAMSTRNKILMGLATIAPTAIGAFANGGQGALAAAGGTLSGLDRGQEVIQDRQDRQSAQRNQQRGQLLTAIEAENRTQAQEDAADRRFTIQQQMENQREKERQASQERVFGQQNQIEATREGARQSALKSQMDEQDKRQQNQFAEQEKLEGMRESAADRRQAASDARRDKGQDAKWEQVASKRYETAMDAEQRLSRMEASYKEATTKGDQQAMLALLTDHIGMTLGMQKGARITKDILQEATASQPWLAKVKAKFDDRGYLSGVTLGPDQMRQMLQLGYGARDRAVQGAYDESQMYGVAPPKGADAVFGKRKPGDMPALQQGGAKQWNARTGRYE